MLCSDRCKEVDSTPQSGCEKGSSNCSRRASLFLRRCSQLGAGAQPRPPLSLSLSQMDGDQVGAWAGDANGDGCATAVNRHQEDLSSVCPRGGTQILMDDDVVCGCGVQDGEGGIPEAERLGRETTVKVDSLNGEGRRSEGPKTGRIRCTANRAGAGAGRARASTGWRSFNKCPGPRAGEPLLEGITSTRSHNIQHCALPAVADCTSFPDITYV